MTLTRIIVSLAAILLGGFLVAFGGMDDSPGAQLLGVVIILSTIVTAIRNRKKS